MSENSKIYIASKDVLGTGYRHLYLVYDLDGNLTTDFDQRVIRGGNVSNDGTTLNLVLEVNVPIGDSEDDYNTAEPDAASRGFYELNIGGLTADQAWTLMTGFAGSLGTAIPGNDYLIGEDYDTGYVYDYAPVVNSTGYNSNSTVASILSQFDIRLQDVTPLDVTTTTPNDHFDVEIFPDYNNQYGGTGDDKFLIESVARNIDGRGGSDTANFTNVFTGLTIDLTKEEFSGLLVDGDLKNIEHVIGTNYDDTVIGDVGGNTLNGGSGVDTIRGGLGNDTILGGVGNDILNGEGGIDTVNGEAGNDTIIYRLSDHSIVLSGNEVLNGGADTDTLRIELRSSELTMALRNELLAVYSDMVVNPPLNGSSYTFTNLNLQISNFENMEVWVDGQKMSLAPDVYDATGFAPYYSTGVAEDINGNLFYGNGHWIYYQTGVKQHGYSFGELTAVSGTFTTTSGGSITISSNGDYHYEPPSTSYEGQDSYTFTVTDASGQTSTATISFAISERIETWDGATFSGSSIPVYKPNGTSLPHDPGDWPAPISYFTGSNYADILTLVGPDGPDGGLGHVIGSGLGGDDTMDGIVESGELYGGDGDDIVGLYSWDDWQNDFEAGHLYVDGGNGNDVVFANYYGPSIEEYDTDFGSLSTELLGGAGNDYIIFVNPMSDDVSGGDGDDIINIRIMGAAYTGGFGTDTIDGGSGIDTLTAGHAFDVNLGTGALIYGSNTGTINTISNVENVIGSGENDKIYGSSVDNKLEGGNGNDELYGAGGNDLLYGGNGDDTYIIKTGEGVDQIFDTSGTDKIKFGTGITAGTLTYFSEGDDLLIKHNGTTLVRLVDHLYNPNNIETIQFSDNSTLSLKDVFIRTLKGTDGADTITASKGAIQDVINGNGGNDAIYAYAGNDKVNGGAGNDTVYAHEGNDTAVYVYGENIGATDLYYGGIGSDTLELRFQSADITQDIKDDIAAYLAYLANPSNINTNAATGGEYVFSEFGLTAGRFETLKVFVDGIEQPGGVIANVINGTEGDDLPINGTSGADVIYGKGGNDTINAGAGNDTLDGGTGYNLLRGGIGDDTYVLTAANLSGSGNETYIQEYIGEGTDTLLLSDLLPSDIFTYTDNNADYYIRLKTETTATVISWADTASADNEIANYIEHIKFADGTTWNLANGLFLNDSDDSNGYMAGSANNDTIHMNGGDDGVYGGAGNDLITGGTGDDNVYGGDGNDTLAGNDGSDYLFGGAGVDTFVFEAANAFNNVDTIGDFTVSDGDKLDLSDLLIGYIPGTSDINDFLSFTADTWNKTLVVDRDGTGSTYSGEEVVIINNGVSQVGTIDDLFNNNQIIV